MERAGLCGRGRRTRPLPDGSVSVELSCLFDSSKVGSALGVLSNVGSWRSAGGCRGVARLPSLCCISRASSLSEGWPKSACPQSETARYPTQFGPHEVQARTLLGRPCSFVRALARQTGSSYWKAWRCWGRVFGSGAVPGCGPRRPASLGSRHPSRRFIRCRNAGRED